MADLTVNQGPAETPSVLPPAAVEVRRQVFEATGYTLTDEQLVPILRALAQGAAFNAMVSMLGEMFRQDQTQAIWALNEFAKTVPEPTH